MDYDATYKAIPNGLKKITITDASVIRNGAFSKIQHIEEITLNGVGATSTLTSIETGAFYGFGPAGSPGVS